MSIARAAAMKPNSRRDRARKRRQIVLGVALIGVLTGELFFYTWCRMQCVRVGYEIAEQTQKQEALLGVQNNLKLELERLKSPVRLETIARQKLGLDRPKPEQVLVIP
jgi:cell division protein FtsL